jgi:hypothetical protein
MITLSQFPEWLKGELYNSLSSSSSNEDDDNCRMIRPLKTDLVFHTLKDVLELLDTCLYTGVEYLPQEVYTFACQSSSRIIREMKELEFDEGPLTKYYEFTKTPEYKALRICAHFEIWGKHIYKVKNMHEALLLQAISFHNNKPLVVYCTNADRNCVNIDIFKVAIINGNIEIVKYLIANNETWIPVLKKQSEDFLLLVTKYADNVDMLAYLYKKLEAKWTRRIVSSAIINKFQFCAEYAIKNGCEIHDSFTEIAIRDNLLIILIALIERGVCLKGTSYYLNLALQYDREIMLRYIYHIGGIPDEKTVELLSSNTTNISETCRNFAEKICGIHQLRT